MLTIAIQAGGQSRRMGQDKALLPFLGRPLIVRVLERVAPLAAELIVTTNQPQAYEFLKAYHSGLRLATDAIPGRGALGGLYTALISACHPLVAVVACDMPFVSPDLLQAQASILMGGNSSLAAAIPSSEGGIEPFHAVYQRSACLPAVAATLSEGKWRVDAWFSDVTIQFMSPIEVRQYDPEQLAFWNVNTPEEFAAAENRAAAEARGKDS